MTIVSKGDKDTRAPGLEIQIMYKTDSNPSPDDLEFQNIESNNNIYQICIFFLIFCEPISIFFHFLKLLCLLSNIHFEAREGIKTH